MYVLYSFWFMSGKKIGIYLPQAGNKLLNMFFFIGVALPIVSWRTIPVSLCQSSELPQKHWHHSHNNRNWLKQPQSHFHLAIPHRSYHFSLFWCILCTVTPDISSSGENINKYDLGFRTIFLFLMTMVPGI